MSELRLGQDVRALHVDRVLGRDDHERPRHVVHLAVGRQGAFLHDLEQRRLRLGRGAVDLVAQHDVREYGPALELELVRRLVVDRHARDIGGQQVGRELDAVPRQRDGRGQCPGQGGLAGARDVLEQ